DGERTNCLQHEESVVLGAAEKALVNEALEDVEVGVADRTSRLEVEAAGEDAHPPEQLLLRLVEQLVAPLDRREQCSLPRWQLARDPQRSAARHEELEVWAASEQSRKALRAAEDLLQVVEQKE